LRLARRIEINEMPSSPSGYDGDDRFTPKFAKRDKTFRVGSTSSASRSTARRVK
jgi:hypothetical protein